ncbi:MAG: major capsid protein, partial [Chloroflexota bacterium]
KFDDTFINGDATADAKAFDGLNKLCNSAQAVSMGTNGAALTLDRLDELIDKIKPGKPDMLLLSRRTRRQLTSLSRATGSGILESDRNQLGQMVQYYDGIPVAINDWVSDAQTQGSSTDCSSIFALQFGEGGVAGLTAPGGLLVERVGSLETKDASRFRVKWYVSLALFNIYRLGKLLGIRPS